MTNVLINTQLDLECTTFLLNREIPTYRQAYSDRTAWIMACLSELAYLRFDPLMADGKQQAWFLQQISKLVDEQRKESLVKLIELVGYDHQKSREQLENELGVLRMQLVKTFNSNGTQAILVSCEQFAVLAFRGTEATSIKDIKTDANARIKGCDSGGLIHAGFDGAFTEIAMDVQDALDRREAGDKPLFITGHSLGGALATVAAKKLVNPAGIAACYTFGSPRVGDEEWISRFKTPVYRIVNAADCVTMLPPGTETVTLLSWMLGLVPWVGPHLQKPLAALGGYIHGGNMRYLTNCRKGEYDGVRLLYSVSWVYRIKGFMIKKLPFKYFLADHSISIYRKKLSVVARSRNFDDGSKLINASHGLVDNKSHVRQLGRAPLP